MFGWFKSDPMKKLQREYHAKLEEAMLAQRKGDMRLYGELTAQATDIRNDILVLEKAK